MERFELSRRFEPTYRISSADPSTAWVHLRIFPPVFNSQNLLERKAGEKAKKYSIWIFGNPELARVFEGTKRTGAGKISSAARYNHFDTLPCINIHFWGLITWFRVLHLRPLGQLSVSIFVRFSFQKFAQKFVGEKTGETAKNIRFWDFLCWGISRRIRGTKFPASAEISSQPRYDHFDTSPCMSNTVRTPWTSKKRKNQNVRTAC